MNVSTIAVYQSLSNDCLALDGTTTVVAPDLGSYFEFPLLEEMSGIRIKSRTLLAPATPNASKNPLLAAQVSVFTSMIVDSFFSNENDIHGVLPSIIALSQCIKFGWIPSYISKVHRFIMPIVF